jgi:hypothetical protein
MFGLLPTRIHGFMDYLMGVALVAIPLASRFGAGPQTWLPVLLGGGAILYSLFTDYELGAVRMIPMPAHLVLDAMSGLLLAASPWIFGFSEFIWMPHVVLGLAEVGAAMITQVRPAPMMRPTGRLGASA